MIYPAPNIALSDNGWTAGEPGDCIGLNILSYNDSSIVFTLGSGYNLAGYYGPLIDGDSIAMSVEGTTFNGTVSYPYQRPPYAFITDPGPNTVSQMDTTTGVAGNFFPFNPDEDADLAITPDGATAYVMAVNGDQLNPFDTATGSVGSNITVGSQTDGPRHQPGRLHRLCDRRWQRLGDPDRRGHRNGRDPDRSAGQPPLPSPSPPTAPPPTWSAPVTTRSPPST